MPFTLAHVGPPSRPVPLYSANRTPFPAITASICSRVKLIIDIFALRDQHEPICPADVPELTYKNLRSFGPCAYLPRKLGVSPTRSTETSKSNSSASSETLDGGRSSSVPRWTFVATPAGGLSTLILIGISCFVAIENDNYIV